MVNRFKKGDHVKMVGGGYEGGHGIVLGKNRNGGYNVHVEGLPSEFVKYTNREGKKVTKKLPSTTRIPGAKAKWLKKK